MDSFYIATNDQQSGPMSLEDIQAKVKRGEYGREALYWKEGMDEWKPLPELVEMIEESTPPRPPPVPASTPPPPPPPAPTTASISSGTIVDEGNSIAGSRIKMMRQLWTALIPLYAIGAFCSFGLDIMSMDPETGDFGAFYLFFLAVLSAGTVVSSILHYKLWIFVDPNQAATTPGKAIGFIFIPFFNFYWAFITWPKLVDGISRSGYSVPSEPKAMAVAVAALFVAGWTVGIMPMLGTLIYVSYCIVKVMLYRELLDVISIKLAQQNTR